MMTMTTITTITPTIIANTQFTKLLPQTNGSIDRERNSSLSLHSICFSFFRANERHINIFIFFAVAESNISHSVITYISIRKIYSCTLKSGNMNAGQRKPEARRHNFEMAWRKFNVVSDNCHIHILPSSYVIVCPQHSYYFGTAVSHSLSILSNSPTPFRSTPNLLSYGTFNVYCIEYFPKRKNENDRIGEK